VLGIKTHTGWAAVVALAKGGGGPEVVAKRRVEMASTFEEGAIFHVSQELPLAKAEALIRSSEARFTALARDAVAELLAELRATGGDVVRSAIVSGGGKALPHLAAILKSHALVHAAEGELYRRVLAGASEACGVPVVFVPAKELSARAAAALDVPEPALSAHLAALGKASGRPWRRDQKECALAALAALRGR
jgi:hypothetical protein